MQLETPPKPDERGKILIDGDVVCYRAAWSADKKEPVDALKKANEVIDWILHNAGATCEYDDFHVFLSGSTNFRKEVAVTAPYKGNRDSKKPQYLQLVRQYLQDNYPTTVSDGEEADDLLSITATDLGPSAIIASIDKDMLQVPCLHYNFNKDLWFQTEDFEGLVLFYQQILQGDGVDNIIGIPGVGPVKAARLLKGASTESELWAKVVEAFDGDTDRALENARLVWLRRKIGELWEPPEN